MRTALAVLTACTLLGSGCPKSQPTAPQSEVRFQSLPFSSIAPATWPAGDASRGRALVETFECARCHEVAGHKAPVVGKQCVGCHRQILDGTFKAPPSTTKETLARWKRNIVDLLDAPSLQATSRFRRDWLVSFLLEPQDHRPRMTATMPRLALTVAQARDLAAYLVPQAPAQEPSSTSLAAAFDRADLSRGRRLLDERGCGSCHVFSGAKAIVFSKTDVDPVVLGRAIGLAPDLRHARERLRPATLLAFLRSPKAVKPDTLMPETRLSPEEALDVAAYLLRVKLDPAPSPKAPRRPTLLARKVRWPDVRDALLHKICWHCHADPDFALGDGGPGNTGGFGFAPRGLNLAEYEGVASGLIGPDGDRQSVFVPMPKTAPDVVANLPRLVAALVARQSEEAGRPIPGLRGMPLGLPSLPQATIDLVATWVHQGRPE